MCNLREKLDKIFLKSTIFPLIIFGISIIMILMVMRGVMFHKITSDEFIKNEKILKETLHSKGKSIEQKFKQIELFAKLLQIEHKKIFEHKNIKNHHVKFAVAKNGVFYKTTKKGSSLYYSSSTKIGENEKQKALFSEEMDEIFKELVENNDLIVQVYFNSFDGMTRIYPYIDKVYKQFGANMDIQNYNFYYLADKKHNPKREPVWTEPYLDPAGKGWKISCIVPIYRKDFLEGVSGIDITIEKIKEEILAQKLAFDTKMTLIGNDGTIIALPKELEKLFNVKELTKYNYTKTIKTTIKKPKEFNIFNSKNHFATIVSNMLKNSNKRTLITVNDDEYLILLTKIPTLNSNLLLISQKSKILESTESFKLISVKILLLVIFLFILFILFVYFYSSRKFSLLSNEITTPLLKLTKMVSKIDKNRQIHRIDTDIEEISILFQSFVLMIKDIKNKEKALKELNYELEEKIQKATQELVVKNKELTEALANFQTIFDLTLEMIVFIKDGKVIDINNAGLRMTGYSSKFEIIGRDFSQFVPKEEVSKIVKAFQMESSDPYEVTLINKSGKYLNTLAAGKYIYLNGQKVRLSTIIDITEIKTKDKMLFLLAKQAQLEEMLKMIAHHWRQPINSISATSIDMTIKKELDDLSDDEFFKANEFIQKECQKISKVIDEFLEFSKDPTKIEEFYIYDAIKKVSNIAKMELKSLGIDLKLMVENRKIKTIGHEGLLEQVLLSLLSNAKDAYAEIESKRKEILISLHKNGTITITDYAGGIAKENRDKLFIPYFTTKEQGDGLGLGLYLNRRIMREQFDGDLIYKNFKNGSTFILKFGKIFTTMAT